MASIVSINPATGERIEEYPIHSEAQVQQALEKAHERFLSWRRVPHAQRAQYLHKVADLLLAGKEKYGRLISQEMGKPLKEAVSEVEKCAACAQYFAENGEAFLSDHAFATEHHKSYAAFQPLGVVLGVMPWNFPFWQVFRFALPALMAGNVGVLKHASNTPGSAMAIESVFREAGLPEGCFTTLMIPSSRVEAVIANKLVAAVTLTGSTPAGRSVAAAAGQHLKKTVLELGGSDPYLILADADVEKAVNICGNGRLLNCGQSCISVKRMIVVPQVRERFEQGITELFRKQVMGDPFDAATTIGPMSRADLRDELHDQVTRSIEAGAKCLLGGQVPQGKGAFYPPTVLTGVAKGMAAYEEEIFGPVALIVPAKDEADAIRIANDSEYGLGGGVFTADRERGEAIARDEVETGSCFVNAMVRSDPRLPFGGIKHSGYGRELSSFGIREFVNLKTIVVT